MAGTASTAASTAATATTLGIVRLALPLQRRGGRPAAAIIPGVVSASTATAAALRAAGNAAAGPAGPRVGAGQRCGGGASSARVAAGRCRHGCHGGTDAPPGGGRRQERPAPSPLPPLLVPLSSADRRRCHLCPCGCRRRVVGGLAAASQRILCHSGRGVGGAGASGHCGSGGAGITGGCHGGEHPGRRPGGAVNRHGTRRGGRARQRATQPPPRDTRARRPRQAWSGWWWVAAALPTLSERIVRDAVDGRHGGGSGVGGGRGGDRLDRVTVGVAAADVPRDQLAATERRTWCRRRPAGAPPVGLYGSTPACRRCRRLLLHTRRPRRRRSRVTPPCLPAAQPSLEGGGTAAVASPVRRHRHRHRSRRRRRCHRRPHPQHLCPDGKTCWHNVSHTTTILASILEDEPVLVSLFFLKTRTRNAYRHVSVTCPVHRHTSQCWNDWYTRP